MDDYGNVDRFPIYLSDFSSLYINNLTIDRKDSSLILTNNIVGGRDFNLYIENSNFPVCNMRNSYYSYYDDGMGGISTTTNFLIAQADVSNSTSYLLRTADHIIQPASVTRNDKKTLSLCCVGVVSEEVYDDENYYYATNPKVVDFRFGTQNGNFGLNKFILENKGLYRIKIYGAAVGADTLVASTLNNDKTNCDLLENFSTILKVDDTVNFPVVVEIENGNTGWSSEVGVCYSHTFFIEAKEDNTEVFLGIGKIKVRFVSHVDDFRNNYNNYNPTEYIFLDPRPEVLLIKEIL